MRQRRGVARILVRSRSLLAAALAVASSAACDETFLPIAKRMLVRQLAETEQGPGYASS